MAIVILIILIFIYCFFLIKLIDVEFVPNIESGIGNLQKHKICRKTVTHASLC